MKKIICMLLACVLCVTALGGCQGQKEPWSLEDFSLYDQEGNLVEEFPNYENIGNLVGKENWCTKRGVKWGDPASKIMEEYPLENAVVRYDVEREKSVELHEKYNTVEEFIKDIKNAPTSARSVTQIVIAFTEQDGKLIPAEYNEKVFEPYRDKENAFLEMIFWLEGETIKMITVAYDKP